MSCLSIHPTRAAAYVGFRRHHGAGGEVNGDTNDLFGFTPLSRRTAGTAFSTRNVIQGSCSAHSGGSGFSLPEDIVDHAVQ
jgi:hypothetical protein